MQYSIDTLIAAKLEHALARSSIFKSTIYARLLLTGRSFYAVESIDILKKATMSGVILRKVPLSDISGGS